MSIKLINLVRPLSALTFGEKSILFQLADISHNGETVFIRMQVLADYAGCGIRTAQRLVRQLEKKGLIIPEGEGTTGRGYIHVWRFNIESTPQPVEEAPPSSTGFSNGHVPPAPPDPNNDEELLQRLRKTLADRQAQQERYIETHGRPNPTIAGWIEISERKIKEIERELLLR